MGLNTKFIVEAIKFFAPDVIEINAGAYNIQEYSPMVWQALIN